MVRPGNTFRTRRFLVLRIHNSTLLAPVKLKAPRVGESYWGRAPSAKCSRNAQSTWEIRLPCRRPLCRIVRIVAKAQTIPDNLGSRENDNLQLPFETEIFGLKVTVERIDLTEGDEIVAVFKRSGKRQKVPILDLSLPSPPPEGAEWIAAYRYWRRGLQ